MRYTHTNLILPTALGYRAVWKFLCKNNNFKRFMIQVIYATTPCKFAKFLKNCLLVLYIVFYSDPFNTVTDF